MPFDLVAGIHGLPSVAAMFRGAQSACLIRQSKCLTGFRTVARRNHFPHRSDHSGNCGAIINEPEGRDEVGYRVGRDYKVEQRSPDHEAFGSRNFRVESGVEPGDRIFRKRHMLRDTGYEARKFFRYALDLCLR